MMQKLRGYVVVCAEGNILHYVGVLASSMANAYKIAEYSLLEGRNIKAIAISADFTDKI